MLVASHMGEITMLISGNIESFCGYYWNFHSILNIPSSMVYKVRSMTFDIFSIVMLSSSPDGLERNHLSNLGMQY